MSSQNTLAVRLKDIFWRWDQEKLKRTLKWIFIIELIFFIIFYFLNRNPVQKIVPQIGPPGPPTFLYAIYGTDQNPFKKPMAVAVSGNRIYVTDTGNQRVQVFDYDGNSLFTFGKPGTDKGQFKFPYGIAVDGDGKVYVADMYNGKISVFNSEGIFQYYFGSPSDISRPAGLFISGNRLYVTDVGKNKVMAFTLDGKKVLEFGKMGTANGEFRAPNCVWVANGKIYVADSGNDRVQVFNLLGGYAYTLTGGNNNGETFSFVNPRGVGVDGRGVLYVVDNLNSRICAFDQNGNYLFTFGSKGADLNQFILPNGLFVDDQGRIYITDTVNQRVVVYQS